MSEAKTFLLLKYGTLDDAVAEYNRERKRKEKFSWDEVKVIKDFAKERGYWLEMWYSENGQ